MVAWETASRWIINSWWNLCEYVPASHSTIQVDNQLIVWNTTGRIEDLEPTRNHSAIDIISIHFMTRAYVITASSVCAHSHTLKEGNVQCIMNFSMPSSPSQEPSWNINVHFHVTLSILPKMVEVERWKYRFLSASEFLSFASRVPFGSLVPAVFYRNWSNQMRLYNWIILTTKPPAPWLGVKGSLGWWANVFRTNISESSHKNKSNQWENWFGHSWRYMFLLERSSQCRIGQHGVASCFPWLPFFFSWGQLGPTFLG